MANGKRGRGRPRKTEDKADKAETRKVKARVLLAPPGLNLNPNRMKQAADNLHGYDENVRDAGLKRKRYTDSLKAEGVNLSALRDMIRNRKKDHDQIRNYLEQYALGLEGDGVPARISVFDAAYGNSVEQAKAEGRAQGASGKGPTPKHQEGTEEYRAYMVEYMKAQANFVPGADNLTADELEDALDMGSSPIEGVETSHEAHESVM